MTRSARRLALFLVLPVILLAALYALWWWRLAKVAESGLAQWVAARRAEGWTVSTGDVDLSGFPFDLALRLSAPAIADGHGNAWSRPPLIARLSPFRLDEPHLAAPGRHLVTLAGAPPLAVEAASLDAVARLDRGRVRQVDLEAAGLAAAGSQLGHLAASWQQVASGAESHDEASQSLTATFDDLTLAKPPAAWLDRHVAQGHLSARLLGNLADLSKSSIAAWSNDGGTIEADSFSVDWPPARLDGNFTLAFDPSLQPLLSGTASAQGLDPLIDRMGVAGALNPAQQALAHLAVAALGKAKKGSGNVAGGTMPIPIAVQNQEFSLGPIPLLRLPPLPW